MIDLIYKWDLKEVRYKDGRKPFVPQRYGGFTLSPSGGISWSDGCNHRGTHYRIDGNKFSLGPRIYTTRMRCSFTIEDVHYEQATHYVLEGQTLFLHTPWQVYVLEKFPYSRMSMNGWSLYAIVDEQTGEEFNVDRLRTEYSHLLLCIQEDKSFHFTDLDRGEFSGSLQVQGEAILHMSYDPESQERLRQKPEKQDYLADNTHGYKRTNERYPTTYAQKINWEAVRSFRVQEGTVKTHGEDMSTTLLEFSTGTQIYRFIPR